MFHLSRKTDYGLLLLIELAHKKQTISLKEFAKSRLISFFFLQKVAYQLRKNGLIEAERGKSGGYFLSREPKKITLKEIFETLEGPVSIAQGLELKEKLPCPNEETFTAHRGLSLLNRDLKESLSRITLQHFISATSSNEKNHVAAHR
jgi:Rrf2 family protein